MDTRWKAITAVMLIITLICVAFIALFNRHQDETIQALINGKQEAARLLAENILEQTRNNYTSRIVSFLNYSADPSRRVMLEAMAAGDKQQLYHYSQPFFQILQKENPDFSTMGFFLPDNTVLLRLHARDNNGDNVAAIRPDIVELNRTQQPNSGFLGGYYGVQYRVVQPVFLEGRYLGGLQFGINATALYRQLSVKLAATTALVIRSEEYTKSYETKGKSLTQDGFTLLSDGVELFSGSQQPLDFTRDSQRIHSGDRDYQLIRAISLLDYSGKQVASMLVALDISQEIEQHRFISHSAIVLSLALLAVSFVILYLSFNSLLQKIFRLSNSLQENNRQLEQRVAERTQQLREEIAEKEKTQNELVEKSLYLKSILHSSTKTAIIAADLDLRIRYFNPEAERYFQTPAAQVLGRSFLEVYQNQPFADAAAISKGLAIIQQQGVHHFTLRPGTGNEQLILHCTVSLIRDDQQQNAGYLLVAHDLSEQVRAQKEKEAIQDQLRKAQKMETIGLMAGGVAHDLNNILSGIVGYPDILLQALPPNDPNRELVESIRDSGLRAAAVVADLLTIARGAVKNKEVTNLNELVGDYLKSPECRELRSRFSAITLRMERHPAVLLVSASPVHIKKCLMNLAHNACEAITGEGQITISTSLCQISDDGLPGLNLPSGRYALLQVSDSGPGIRPEDRDHIFEPFYTRKKMGKSGTGLGLTVVWTTMQDHQGGILVDSSPRGTTFSLYFPLADGSLADQPSLPVINHTGHGEHILVVDDEPLQRDIARQMLQFLGYQPHTVASGEEAISYLQQNPADLLLLDMIMLPGISGRRTYEQIVSRNPRQKALIVTGFAEDREVRATLALGACGVVHKPYSLDQLAQSVALALRS